MTYAVRADQARCAALGVWPGPIDGKLGPRTQGAIAAATAAQKAKGKPFRHASGLDRIHIHWTGGAYLANATDRAHYHVVIEGDGKVLRPHTPNARLAHTLNANGGAIGVSCCAMGGAVERPLRWGDYPPTEAQLLALAREVAALCATYDIPVTRWSVLTHAEVQPTLGIAQRQKWDWTVLPGFVASSDPLRVGDGLRARVIGAR